MLREYLETYDPPMPVLDVLGGVQHYLQQAGVTEVELTAVMARLLN